MTEKKKPQPKKKEEKKADSIFGLKRTPSASLLKRLTG